MKKFSQHTLIMFITLIFVSGLFISYGVGKQVAESMYTPVFVQGKNISQEKAVIETTQESNTGNTVVETIQKSVSEGTKHVLTAQPRITTAAASATAPVAGSESRTETYQLSIPSVRVSVPLMLDVDGQDMAAYFAALEKGVAHYAGTPHPGESGSSLIFGHSSFTRPLPNGMDTAFRALHFVKIGDHITLQNKYHTFEYEVYQTRVIEPTDLEFLSQEGPTRVTLMTCTPIGSTAQRLLVYAKQISAK